MLTESLDFRKSLLDYPHPATWNEHTIEEIQDRLITNPSYLCYSITGFHRIWREVKQEYESLLKPHNYDTMNNLIRGRVKHILVHSLPCVPSEESIYEAQQYLVPRVLYKTRWYVLDYARKTNAVPTAQEICRLMESILHSEIAEYPIIALI